MALSTAGRSAALEEAQRETFDVLVVGGGIVGAGIARDAALRGFRVALVEQHDLASGTSSRPTRLIHGGLRYLEIYDFGLVREDLKEREILLRLAPHLVFPLPFLLPQYGRRRLYEAKLRAGMQLYDLLSFDKSLPSRRWLSREAVLATEPGINPDGLQGAWRYYDAQVPLVERLVVENALDAAAHGATILTHARVERFLRDPGQGPAVTGAVVRDARSGRSVEVRARLTVNATGPWLDRTDGEVRPGRPPLLRLTKGVHLVTPPGTRHAHVLFSQTDGRLFFVVPWLGQSLVGTTDTDFQGDPGTVAADAADVAYLTDSARRAFPAAPFDRVYYTWAGVRALGRVEGVREGQVSRKHRVLDHQEREGLPGIVSVVGGKITAYRGIAEEVGDLLCRRLGRELPSYTDRRPFPGAILGSAPDVEAYVEREVWPRAEGLGLTRAQAGRRGGSTARWPRPCSTWPMPTAASPGRWRRGRRRSGRSWPAPCARSGRRPSATSCCAAPIWGCVPIRGCGRSSSIAAALGELSGWDATERAAQVDAYRAELDPMRRRAARRCPARRPPSRSAETRPGIVRAVRAIVLGAGRGQRLMPLTAGAPKSYAPVAGKRILDWILEALAGGGIERQDVAFVGGYRIEQIRADYPAFAYFHNPDWATTNILASLFCAEPAMAPGFVCSYADILYRPEVVRKLLASPADITLAVDTDFRRRYRRRSQHPELDAEKVRASGDRIVEVNRRIPAEAVGRRVHRRRPVHRGRRRPAAGALPPGEGPLRGRPVRGGGVLPHGLPDPPPAGDARSGRADAPGGHPRRVLRDRHHRGLRHRSGGVDRAPGSAVALAQPGGGAASAWSLA